MAAWKVLGLISAPRHLQPDRNTPLGPETAASCLPARPAVYLDVGADLWAAIGNPFFEVLGGLGGRMDASPAACSTISPTIILPTCWSRLTHSHFAGHLSWSSEILLPLIFEQTFWVLQQI